jgi:hypothetical protein
MPWAIFDALYGGKKLADGGAYLTLTLTHSMGIVGA